MQSFLGIAEEECSNIDQALFKDTSPDKDSPESESKNVLEPNRSSRSNSLTPQSALTLQTALTPHEYFSADDLCGRDVGRPMKMSTKVQRFKANLWLSEDFPIKLQEQVLPILDLMSTMASPHVSKLKDFITMQLPSGFPVKIEIPLFHVLNACVTFGNVFGIEAAVKNVEHLVEEDSQRLSCIIDDACFDVPPNYTDRGADYRRQMTFDDEDDLLQYALQQSLIEAGTESEQVDIWEALRPQSSLSTNNFGDEGTQIQR